MAVTTTAFGIPDVAGTAQAAYAVSMVRSIARAHAYRVLVCVCDTTDCLTGKCNISPGRYMVQGGTECAGSRAERIPCDGPEN